MQASGGDGVGNGEQLEKPEQSASAWTPGVTGDSSRSTASSSSTEASEVAAREERIRLAAYAIAESRGFAPGFEVEDWLEAERQLGEAGRDRD